MKRVSFRFKMLVAFSVLTIVSIGGVWLLFRMLVDDFSKNKYIRDIEAAYDSLNEQFRSRNELTNADMSEIESGVGRHYVLFLYAAKARIQYTTVNTREAWYRDPIMCYSGYRTKIGEEEPEMVSKHEKYNVYLLSDTIDAYGKLDNGFTVLLRANYDSVLRDNRAMTDWLFILGLFVLAVTTLFAIVISITVTKPIKQMSAQAERMAKLDFSARCKVDGQDEIGVLGGALNQLSEQLEQTVMELKNANSELQSDLEYRTQVDEMRSDFIANVSHELKTPIALIRGYAEGLTENVSDDPESRAYYCSVIADEADKMNRMVQKLMVLNQLEFGGNQVEYARFDVVSVIAGILNSTEVLRSQKGISLHFREEEPVYVWADEFMVEEVITNYVSNAINHASKSKELAVSVERKETVARISVYNTGELIPETDIDKIWIKFYKVDKARSREYGGSGIGLSIVKAIMDRHHQKYGVANHENGVEFWFELELAQESAQDSAPVAPGRNQAI
ncbi:MAG: HAMP domain-containing protein [Lachnospiraceae bacterium]|nr:HAMP domain-containing protein [Lachnospiraceae bacterium]